MSSTSYSNEIASPEVEIAGEAAGSFFADMKSRHADLKAMLDGNKENLKLEAMKRIITMIAKGKDASDLFPAVVKNVAAKNLELKKLVYVYLTRYAEEQQDLALLSISTFQRALKDPNQLIRASALRVLSSIRVPMIVPIMMLAIKESMRDMSPYVRKTAAHAIPKLYSLDNDQKEELITVIDHLLADRTTLVVGSAVYSFEEVCPDRFDLIHKHYRKLCQLIVDVEEWGQVVMLNMLTRYGRTQFADPNHLEGEEDGEEDDGKFYSSEEESDADSSGDESARKKAAAKPAPKPKKEMDPDLRNLLRATKSLLQSRNASVVLAVAQLYYHLAPKTEVGVIARALIRLLRNHREIQSVVLSNIATISAKRRVDLYLISKNMFEAFLKSFFVRSEDPTHIKLLKLEILTNLATQANISIILREFQTYVVTHDKEFAAATIDAIGRCASSINEVTDVCLSGLVNLMSNRNETVVAQSVVVIKKLLQMQPSQHQDIIVSMARLIDKIQVPAARASIIWLIGEYCQRVPKIAPDVLRKMAKSFINEEEIVKLQVLNLAVKLLLTNPEQTQLLVQYVFMLARYDQSYDLRDRARFLRNLVMPQKQHKLTQFAMSVFLTPKPAPVIEGRFKDRESFQLGTLSHYLNQRCSGYHELPDFPEEPPDPSVRNVEAFPSAGAIEKKPGAIGGGGALSAATTQPTARADLPSLKKFYSETEDEDEAEEDVEEDDDDDETESEEGVGAGDDDDDEDDSGEESDEEDDDESGDDSGSEEEEESSEEEQVRGRSGKKSGAVTKQPQAPPPPPAPTVPAGTKLKEKEKDKRGEGSKGGIKASGKKGPPSQDMDLLLDFGTESPSMTASAPVMTAAASITPLMPQTGPIIPSTTGSGSGTPRGTALKMGHDDEALHTAPAQYIPTSPSMELINRLTGHGLMVRYRFTRSPNLFSSRSVSIELQFSNTGSKPLKDVKIGDKKLPPGMDMSSFPEISLLSPDQSHSTIIGIDYGDTSQPATFDLSVDGNRYPVSLVAPVGEQLQPVVVTADEFKSRQSRLSGMNETSGSFTLMNSLSCDRSKDVAMKVYLAANVIAVVEPPENKLLFAGQTLSGKTIVLISLTRKLIGGAPADKDEEVKLCVNCEKMVIGSMLFKELKTVLS